MEKRIPTLLALIVLIALIGFGFFLQTQQQKQATEQKNKLNPEQILAVNIAESSAAITWQTNTPTTGKIMVNNKIYFDDRDNPNNPQPRHTHFVTLTDLLPNTSYSYYLQIDNLSYPTTPLEFKTITTELAQKQFTALGFTPIRGTVLNDQLEPVDEAIVILNYKDLSPKATFLTTAGNFILPLTKLVNNTLTDTITIPNKSPATLEIRKGSIISLIQLSIPIKDQTLPAITLGKNENFIDFLNIPSTPVDPLEFKQKEPKFDLNNDGKINTLDSSLILDLINRKTYNQGADFNNDKVIDEKRFRPYKRTNPINEQKICYSICRSSENSIKQ